jgi:hypothetical protein
MAPVRQPKSKVVSLSDTLFPAVASHLRAWTDDQGLVIEGQDLGPGVESIWGDSDYEYWLSVEDQYLDRVFTGLAKKLGFPEEVPNRRSKRDLLLLEYLQRSWIRGLFETDIDFRKWLNAIHVPSKFSSYV